MAGPLIAIVGDANPDRVFDPVMKYPAKARKAANTTRSKVRARVEHVVGDQKSAMGAEIGHTIGIVRARCKIGMTNLVYNMRRFIILERMAEVAR